jgi:hypothetical protein
MLVHFVKNKLQYHIVLALSFLLWLLIITYSRSALLWVFSAVWLLILLNIKTIYTKYKKQFLFFIIISSILLTWIWILFNDKLENIILRNSSTTWHFDRMEIWINRFLTKPMWSWLAEAWPAFRNIYPNKQTKQAEQYYIPESWFIQQLIEWGYIYFSLFILILIITLLKLYNKSKSIFAWLLAIIIMNIFLHIFEATYLSILLFLFIWILISKEKRL